MAEDTPMIEHASTKRHSWRSTIAEAGKKIYCKLLSIAEETTKSLKLSVPNAVLRSNVLHSCCASSQMLRPSLLLFLGLSGRCGRP